MSDPGPSKQQALMSLGHSTSPKSAPTRIFTSLRRTLTPGRSSRMQADEDDYEQVYTRSRHLQEDDTARPTVEQIAMGLHLSRTPHLPPYSPTHYHRLSRVESTPASSDREIYFRRRQSFSHRAHASLVVPPRVVPPLPPPPSRSALKAPRSSPPPSSSPKTSLQTLDSASTPASSTRPHTPTSQSSPARHFTRLSRFARGIVSGGSSVKLVTSSQSTSEVSVALSEPLRKSVRFEGSDHPQ